VEFNVGARRAGGTIGAVVTATPENQAPALYHRDLGGSGEPPLVLLHGLLGSSRNWQTAGRELAAARRVFALDLRNHGQSPHAPDMSYFSMMGDVLAWLDSNVAGPVELLGHSMGGKVAMLLACRHPGRVARLVVVDIAPKAYRWPECRKKFAAMNRLDLSSLHSRAEAEGRLEAQVPGWAERKFLTTNLERTGEGWKWQIDLAAITAALPELESNPIAAGDRYAGPTLFVTGAKSGYTGPSDRDLILGHFRAARFEVIAGSGHNPHIEAREAFVRAVS
jgi:pimeloyl-ACP methyl ester carboxylesterase